MNFLAPLGFFFALFLPAVVILYLLKLKRVNIPIASTLLWKKSLEDLRANAPFQKLKRNLLMFLQLIAIALLTLAITRPVLRLGGLEGQSYIVLIDHSASMAATDVLPNRLEDAKAKAIELVNDMSVGDRMMVVAFASGARVLSTFEEEKAILREVIGSIEATDNATHIDEALRIARSAAEVQPNAEIVIFSDGRFTIPQDSPLAALDTRFIPVGVSSDNVGIVDLVVRRDFEVEQNTQVLISVLNSGAEAKTVFLELYGVHERDHPVDATATATVSGEERSRELLDAYELELEAGGRQTIVFRDPGTFPNVIEVKLDSADSLAADNLAWGILPNKDDIKVLLVSEGNFFLERALSLDLRAAVSMASPAGYSGPEDFDLIIFDAFSPPVLVNGNYLFLNAVPPLPEWSSGDELTLPAVVDWDRFHPLNRYITFENLIINKTKNLGVPAWADVLLETRETPLIVAFQQKEIRGLVVGFDIYDTNWPLRVSFPIFFSNLIDWVMNESELSESLKHTGDILTLQPPVLSNGAARLEGPDDAPVRELQFTEDAPKYVSDLDRAGVYRYVAGNAVQQQYAVNLLSADESDIAPNRSLAVGASTIEGDIEAVTQNREIWRYLAICAILIVMIEWIIYVRRARYSV